MCDSSKPVIYQLKIVLQGISPMIWRRLLVKSDCTIKDLHYTVQIAMGWENIHLHYFTIHGKQYEVRQPGGISFDDDASQIKLSQFEFRKKKQFLYEYDFSKSSIIGAWRYWWRHQIRVEVLLPLKSNQIYPICTGGKGVCPPEDCGGPWSFMQTRDEFSILDLIERFTLMLKDKNFVMDREEATSLLAWLSVYENKFDRHQVNQRLQQYATKDVNSILFE